MIYIRSVITIYVHTIISWVHRVLGLNLNSSERGLYLNSFAVLTFTPVQIY
jgi:hypothetical protein